VGIGAILGDRQAAFRNVVQVPGSFHKIGFRTFLKKQNELPVFHRNLLAYCRAFIIQLMQSVACNNTHNVRQRYARWLLMCHDRVSGDEFHITQEFLGEMMGVSRISVGAVARSFQREGVVKCSRGLIAIADRRRLEAASCECYVSVRRHYDRLSPGSFTK
jgi:CRP-like cAMP-binding protein